MYRHAVRIDADPGWADYDAARVPGATRREYPRTVGTGCDVEYAHAKRRCSAAGGKDLDFPED